MFININGRAFCPCHSLAQSCPTLWTRGRQHARLPCPSPSPRACSNSCPSSQWRHPAISSSVVPFSSRLQSFPASGSFPVSRFFKSGGQSIGVLASPSVLPMKIQDWFPLGWTHLISLLSQNRIICRVSLQNWPFCRPSWNASATKSYIGLL